MRRIVQRWRSLVARFIHGVVLRSYDQRLIAAVFTPEFQEEFDRSK
jgi:hypothetical protein